MKIDRSLWQTDSSRAQRIQTFIECGLYVPECDDLFLCYYSAAFFHFCLFCHNELYRTVVSIISENNQLVYGIRHRCWGCDLDVNVFQDPGSRFCDLEFHFLDYCHQIKKLKGVK